MHLFSRITRAPENCEKKRQPVPMTIQEIREHFVAVLRRNPS
jgi:hypothetical protein